MDEKRIKELEEKVQLMVNKVSQLEFKVLELSQSAQKATKAVEKVPFGKPVWEAYRQSFLNLYGVEPVRNAKVNRNCLDIFKRLGTDAPAVVQFYLTLTDQQFVRMNHPLGLLLMSCESIHSMWKRGKMTTSAEARKVEAHAVNSTASAAYLERKYAKK